MPNGLYLALHSMVSLIYLEIMERGQFEFKSKYFEGATIFISNACSSQLQKKKVLPSRKRPWGLPWRSSGLRPHASSAGGEGLISGLETRILLYAV